MRYVSVCSGIEAATVAWHPLGWEPVMFAEIEPFPCAVLKHHYPHVPLVGDFTQLIVNPPEADLLVGGTPCQAFSVAGKRLSLEDYRGNLSLAFADLFHAGQYRWALWENVPGVLSTKDNAFGCLLGRLVGSDAPLLPSRGRKWTNAGVVSGPLATAAWRVLDAQYFGVAQRRRRVFVCVSRGAGNWSAPSALLPVGESVSGHPPARRQAGQDTAPIARTGVARSLRGRANHAHREDSDNVVVGILPAEVAPTLNAAFGEKQGLEDQHINGGAGMFVLGPVPQVLRNREGKPGGGKGPLLSENQSLTLGTANDQVVFAVQNPTLEKAQNGLGVSDGPMYTLESSRPHGVVFAGDVAPTVSQGPPFSRTGNERVESEALVVAFVQNSHLQLRPRRLTPTECERLQGFPDGNTSIPWKKGTAPDGPRYKALGNSMAVPVMAYIGKRIQSVEDGNA